MTKAVPDIVEAIEAHGIELIPGTGGALKCVCPWHEGAEPVLIVHPARNFFRCYGCGKGGDAEAFDAMMKEKQGE